LGSRVKSAPGQNNRKGAKDGSTIELKRELIGKRQGGCKNRRDKSGEKGGRNEV